MKVKDMIRENNRLREQLTPSNRSYLEDMILALRDSPVDALRTEELLLEAAKLLLQAQEKGKSAQELFGKDPESYFQQIISSAPVRPPRSKLNYYLMIPWAALTCLFGILSIGGLIMLWSSGTAGIFGQISLFTLIAVGAGSVILVEMLMKWLSSLSEDDKPYPKPFDIKRLGSYIVIAIIAVFAGRYLDTLLPVIPISPWVSLALFIVGVVGLKFIFFKK
ncbi:DUF1129 family protein [Paenibacillus albidus]|uniref:DUF1129 family protein n=1 Tax=Paenibacillus albidus TaxID=2041023 RepID=UPI001BE9E0DD|nr:DUF1129 family protein [Paenibacillus albidus]MBT2289103.1 DUF1129 family protein [Paenibacillus albidus]